MPVPPQTKFVRSTNPSESISDPCLPGKLATGDRRGGLVEAEAVCDRQDGRDAGGRDARRACPRAPQL